MEQLDPAPLKKARAINLDNSFYGTFAEIGAGQEVARYFFVAGRASQTIAKTISAYDMTFSDSIYGKSGRYVCEDRVLRMLEHEFYLLTERLGEKRGSNTRFFAFADTVATSSQGEPSARCHGWMGLRFQTRPGGPTHDLIVHVRMKDRTRLQQQQTLGVLGVNMVHIAWSVPNSRQELLADLIDGLGAQRVEINLVRTFGPDFGHLDNRLINLEMVRQGIADAVLFEANGSIANPSDVFFHKPVIVQRGTFRPVTKVNLKLLERGIAQFKGNAEVTAEPVAIFELTMSHLINGGHLEETDFLDRVDTLCALGHRVLLSNFDLFYQVKQFLRTYTDQPLALLVGAGLLEKLFTAEYYKSLPGGILEGFSRLFDDRTQLLVFPLKVADSRQTAATFHPSGAMNQLYRYFFDAGKIRDILNCDDVDTSIHSQDVREMLHRGDARWEELVPSPVRDLIKKRAMFGIRA